MKLPKLIEDLSNKGCTDAEAIEITTDLMKIDMLRERLGQQLDEITLDKVIEATKQAGDQERKLSSLLNVLSPRERQCYLLHTVELLSMGKISDQLGVSKSAVQCYIERAREKLGVL